MDSTKCKYCGGPIGYENYEWGFDFCDWCSEIAEEQSNKLREWRHYHPGEPCPEEELPHHSPAVP